MVEEHDVHPPYLSNEEKHLLFRDGYVVIKNCIPKRLTNPAKEVIYGMPYGEWKDRFQKAFIVELNL